MEVRASSGLPQGRVLGAADLGVVQALLEEVAINPTIELPELTQGWEIDSWGAQTAPCAPGPRRKEQ